MAQNFLRLDFWQSWGKKVHYALKKPVTGKYAHHLTFFTLMIRNYCNVDPKLKMNQQRALATSKANGVLDCIRQRTVLGKGDPSPVLVLVRLPLYSAELTFRVSFIIASEIRN